MPANSSSRLGAAYQAKATPAATASTTSGRAMSGRHTAAVPVGAEIGPAGRCSTVITGSPLGLQGILVHLTVLHDDDEIFLGISEQRDVVQRIAVDQQQVGQRPGLDHAELAGIGIARAAEAKQ